MANDMHNKYERKRIEAQERHKKDLRAQGKTESEIDSLSSVYEGDRTEAIEHFRGMWKTLGNLTDEEMDELTIFEFLEGAQTIDDQVRRYFLKLKTEQPEKANRMQGELEVILRNGVNSVGDVKNLCYGLHNYWSGFIIEFNGEAYTVHNHQFGKTSDF